MANQDDKSPQRKANQKDGVSIDTIKSQLKAIQDVARGADRGGLQRVQSQLADQPPAPKIKGSLSSNRLNSE